MEFSQIVERLKSNKLFLPAIGIGVAAGAYALWRSQGEGGEGGFLSDSDNGGGIGDIPEITVPEDIGSGGGGGGVGDNSGTPTFPDIGGDVGGGYLDIPLVDGIFGSGTDYGAYYPDDGGLPYMDTFMSEMRDMISSVPYVPEQLGYISPDIPEIDYSPAPVLKQLTERIGGKASTVSTPKLSLAPKITGAGARTSAAAIQASIKAATTKVKSSTANIVKPKAPSKSSVANVRGMVKSATPKINLPKIVSKPVSTVKKVAAPKVAKAK